MNALREVLDPWLGKPQWKQSEGRVTLFYRFPSENIPPLRLRLKIEINSREHFSVYGFTREPFAISSRWFEGTCEIGTYALDELLGTKMRALYQRKKGRDLFDLAIALEKAAVDPDRIVAAFSEYMARDGHRVTRAQFRKKYRSQAARSAVQCGYRPAVGQWIYLGR
jgi:predicted nucleotidyltransferase component of viral defense system